MPKRGSVSVNDTEKCLSMESSRSIYRSCMWQNEFLIQKLKRFPCNLFSFWIRNSFTSMESKSGNNATDEQKGRIFGEYSNDEEESSQIETDMNS